MEFLLNLKNKLKSSAPFALFLISLFDFLVYYIINLLFWESDAAVYTAYYVSRFFEFALPIFAAAIMLTHAQTMKRALLSALLLSLPRLVYTIPYYYLDYVYDIYDSKEAILLSLATSAAVILFVSLKTYIFYAVMRFFIKRAGIDAPTFPIKPFDLERPEAFGILAASLTAFLVSLGFEIYDTVVFFIEAGTRYRTSEILSIVGSYVFLIAAFILTHAISCLLASYLKKKS